jgi:hypothetical protein
MRNEYRAYVAYLSRITAKQCSSEAEITEKTGGSMSSNRIDCICRLESLSLIFERSSLSDQDRNIVALEFLNASLWKQRLRVSCWKKGGNDKQEC